MQPRTSVRQPIIAGARQQHLSELLRQWRRQPRKRAPLLFWTLILLALMSDSGLLVLITRFLGVWGSSALPIECLAYEDRPREHLAARQALYWSLLTAGFFMAAAVFRLRRPQWRRHFLFAGLLAGLGCLGWSAAALLGQAIPEGAAPLGTASQGILWSAALVMGLGLFFAVLFRDTFLALTGALVSGLGFLAAHHWPLACAGPWPPLLQGIVGDSYLYVPVLLLLSAYAVLALAWGTAALMLAQIVGTAPSSERLHRLAALCLWSIRLAVLLLTASALLDGWRTLSHLLDPTQNGEMPGWNAQALGTFLVLPSCIALLYARWRGWLPPFHLLAAVVLGFAFVAMMGQVIARWRAGDLTIDTALAADIGFYEAGLFSLSLAVHAALRYYFGKQRILEAGKDDG